MQRYDGLGYREVYTLVFDEAEKPRNRALLDAREMAEVAHAISAQSQRDGWKPQNVRHLVREAFDIARYAVLEECAQVESRFGDATP